MTSPTDAPHTAAGRRLHARIFGLSDRMPDGAELDNLILAIEAEAAAGLDVERLARALADEFDGWAKGSERYVAERVAAAYSEGESTN